MENKENAERDFAVQQLLGEVKECVDAETFENAFGTYAQLLTMTDMGNAGKSLDKLFHNLDSKQQFALQHFLVNIP